MQDGYASLIVTTLAVFGLLALLGSEESLANEIDCEKSFIQHSIKEAIAPREGDCMKETLNSPLTGFEFVRSIRTPDMFAIVVSDHVRARTYVPQRNLSKLIKKFSFVEKDGMNFAEIERSKIGDKTYRAQRFDLPEDIQCYGFLINGSPHFDGYGAQAFGVFCKRSKIADGIRLDDLTKFLGRLKVRDIL